MDQPPGSMESERVSQRRFRNSRLLPEPRTHLPTSTPITLTSVHLFFRRSLLCHTLNSLCSSKTQNPYTPVSTSYAPSPSLSPDQALPSSAPPSFAQALTQNPSPSMTTSVSTSSPVTPMTSSTSANSPCSMATSFPLSSSSLAANSLNLTQTLPLLLSSTSSKNSPPESTSGFKNFSKILSSLLTARLFTSSTTSTLAASQKIRLSLSN